jgi:aryl-alcohol dehydrogenase-like predicted oxidoreductase
VTGAAQQRALGCTGLDVGAIGLGCMGMSWVYAEQRQDTRESEDVIRGAVGIGVTLLDTADMYGPFANEELVGRAIAGLRDDVVLATKGGLIADAGMRRGAVQVRRDGRPEHLRTACEASLRRLGVDHVDLYYLHRVDPAVPLAESWGALAELRDEGKVSHLGISEATVEELEVASAIAPVAAVQSELSLWSREPLKAVLPWCVEHGAAFVPFAPLGRGFLAGRFAGDRRPEADDFRSGLPRFQPEALERNRRIADEVAAVAERHGATSAQIALAWVMSHSSLVVPIPGSTKLGHIADNVAATAVQLDDTDAARLDALPPPVGSRY